MTGSATYKQQKVAESYRNATAASTLTKLTCQPHLNHTKDADCEDDVTLTHGITRKGSNIIKL